MTTAWDRRTFVRVLGLACAAFAVALLVTAASDEGGITWSERLARTVPAAPLIAALAAALEMRRARTRGELRALEASGASPWQRARAAAIAGATFTVALALSLPRLPSAIAAFFPRPLSGAEYRYIAGAFVDEARGWSVAADGTLAKLAGSSASSASRSLGAIGLPAHAGVAATSTLVLAGIGLSLLATRPWNALTASAWIRALGVLVGVLVGFHYVAATGADALPIAALALFVPLDAARSFFGATKAEKRRAR